VPVRVEHWEAAWGPLSEAAMRKRLEAEGYDAWIPKEEGVAA